MKLTTVVITGASAGIGKAAAKAFAKKGYQLVLLARRKDRLDSIKKEIDSKNIHIFAVDISDQMAITQLFSHIEAEIGPIDILVNNAGIAHGLDPAHKAQLDEWNKCVAVNINGVLYCTHSVLPYMVQRNRGHIINLGSIAGSYSYPGAAVYCASKAFIHQFSLCLRADLLGTNLRVTCLEPGLLGGTEFSLVRFRGDEAKVEAVYNGTKPLSAEDIAAAILFCVEAPAHVNVNTIELMPVCQASAGLSVYRN